MDRDRNSLHNWMDREGYIYMTGWTMGHNFAWLNWPERDFVHMIECPGRPTFYTTECTVSLTLVQHNEQTYKYILIFTWLNGQKRHTSIF